jgi:K+-sensing histidine kinase KdpD
MRQYINWKTYLILVALAIVTTSLIYTNQLAASLAEEEQKNVEQLVEAIHTLYKTGDETCIKYTTMVVEQNKTIPLILTDERDSILSSANIDSSRLKRNEKFLKEELAEYKEMHPPIVLSYGFGKQHVYYGESYLLMQLRYYPYVQLAIIFLFLFIVLVALSNAHRSIQNQVWVGLSKETAHQLGTPLSSIEAWLELLKDKEENHEAVSEMQKDLDRLKLVADRFGKVGSTPVLEEEDITIRLRNMVDYMQKRAPKKVSITMTTNEEPVLANISGPLFDWVIENLIRNALDAMEGKGFIEVKVNNRPQDIYIDITDTGKGIPKHLIKNIFNPGFTTKKRGWGLGLSLSKRIIDKYHHGSLLVKFSEVGKGTTFRIILRR